MTTYTIAGQSASVPFSQPSAVVFKKKVSLAREAAAQGISAFSASDVLKLFDVPKGTLITCCGVRVSVVEGAALTIGVGVTDASVIQAGSAATGFLTSADLNSAAVGITAVSDTYGADNRMGVLFTEDGTIDITFNHAGADTAEFDLFAVGYKVFED